jgi:hypothetical protein
MTPPPRTTARARDGRTRAAAGWAGSDMAAP